jgi:hypothetical protein
VNTDRLARHYPTLSPAERLSLMLAAAARGDEQEHARLVAAAPRLAYSAPHMFGRAQAFLVVGFHSRMERINLAALYFKASTLAESSRGKVAARFRDTARVFGYLVRVHAEGWVLFCERERLDPTVCEKDLPGEFALELAEREATVDGFTPEEALAYSRREEPASGLKTAESVADELGALYRSWFERWE